MLYINKLRSSFRVALVIGGHRGVKPATAYPVQIIPIKNAILSKGNTMFASLVAGRLEDRAPSLRRSHDPLSGKGGFESHPASRSGDPIGCRASRCRCVRLKMYEGKMKGPD